MLSSIGSRDLPFLWFQPLMLSSIGSRGLMLMLSSICSRGLAILAYALVHL